ncbi:hypothetical protein IAT38_001980 [Cryptococcus sp. DSM 104549]
MHPQQHRDNDDDHHRYHHPPSTASYNGPPHRPSSFLHHLPPPIPSANSPMGHFPASPSYRDAPAQSPSGGHTDPSTWASQSNIDRDRPGSSRARGSWGASPRELAHPHTRLPSLSIASDLPPPHHRSGPPTPWDAPSPGSYTMSNARGNSFSAGTGGYRGSPAGGKPPPLATPVSSSNSVPYSAMAHNGVGASAGGPPEEHYSPGGGNPYTPRGSFSHPTPTGRSPATGGSSKHPHPSQSHGTGESEAGDGSQKKKKRRVALSCAECSKRKQKCNRETPCQHCVARRVPELCVPYQRPTSPVGGKATTSRGASQAERAAADKKDVKTESGEAQPAAEKPRPSMLPTISVRVGRLEAMVNAVINRVSGVEGKALRDWRINHPPATSPPPLGLDEDEEKELEDQVPELATERERPGSPSSTHSRRDDNSAEWGGDSGEGEDVVGGLDRATSGRNPLPQSMMQGAGPMPLAANYHGTPAEQLQKLFRDCGVSPGKVTELMRELPNREFAGHLIDWFFQKFNFVRYPIDEYLFKQALETVYSTGGANPATILALPLVFIVFSISMRIAPDALIESEDRKRTMSLKMYWNSKNAVIIAAAVKAENIQLVETRILTGLYLVLMHERRLAEGWGEFRSALTIGQAIGLHRDGRKLNLDPYVTEYRRMLWSYLVHADATYSCLLGRPTSIDEKSVDTLPPSNLELSDILRNKNAKPKPLSEPTYGTYLLLRWGLGNIVAKITQHFQRLQGQTQYRDVEALDAELKQFVADLPPTFTMLTPDKSYDSKLWFLPIHRYYIQTEILHFTIILHRPWLLRKLRSSRYALSRTACFDAAVTDYKLRQAFKIDCPDFFETLLGSSFREFNAAMIAGISMIIDPRSSHSKDMGLIVKSFMEQHPHDPKADDFSQKEAAIIYTLHRRGQEMEEKRRARYPRLSHDNTSFERSSPRNTVGSQRASMPAPPLPHSSSGDNLAGSEGARSVPLPSPSGSAGAHAMFRGSPYGTGMGPTPPGMGASPEDDHPQKLLDHWIVSNTSFGPGADSTMNLGIGLFPMPMPPLAPSADINTNGIPTHAQGTPNPQQPSPGQMGAGYTPTSGYVAGATPGQMNWLDPSLMAGAMGAGGGMPGMGGMGEPPVGGAGQMGGPYAGGDGNNSQYWNALIDGIVGGMSSYDPNFNAVG